MTALSPVYLHTSLLQWSSHVTVSDTAVLFYYSVSVVSFSGDQFSSSNHDWQHTGAGDKRDSRPGPRERKGPALAHHYILHLEGDHLKKKKVVLGPAKVVSGPASNHS